MTLARRAHTALAVAAVIALVVTAQVGLGYAGREQAEAAAWHIPNGLLAFGLAVHQLHLLRLRAGASVTRRGACGPGAPGRR